MSKHPRDDGGDESKEEASKKPRVSGQAAGEKPQCPICFEEWETDENPSAAIASHVPRMLPCFHSMCTECMAEMNILRQEEEGAAWKVVCPLCAGKAMMVKIKGVKPDTGLSALEVAKLMPLNYALVDATHAPQQQPAASAAAAAAAIAGPPPARCIIPGCMEPVTHFCFTKCKEQCAKHERQGHAAANGFDQHECVPIADKAARLAAQEHKDREELLAIVTAAETAEGICKMIEPHEATIQQVLAKLLAEDVEQACRADVNAFVAAQQAAIAQLEATILVLRSDLANFVQAHRTSKATINAAQETCCEKLLALQAECNALSALSVEETLEQKDKFEQLNSKPLSDASAQLQEALLDAVLPPPPHLLIQSVRQIHAPALLPSLGAPQRTNLERFLDDTPLAGALLLFKATRDGQYAKDFIAKCAGKSNTLVLVKAAGTGYLFGAYFACAWPAVGDKKTVVADPSGRSFLFSLVNKNNKPMKLTLRDRDRALSSSDVCFGGNKMEGGKTVGFPNLLMMRNNRSANDLRGMAANSTTLATNCAYQPDDGTECHAAIFAGSQYFAAEEIEVYQLAPAAAGAAAASSSSSAAASV